MARDGRGSGDGDGGIAAIPEELRRVDHEGGGFVSTGAFSRLAREVCPT